MTGRVLRASDQDRHEAVLALSDHFAEGRLDHDEFEARMSSAQQATYLHELDPLFEDLPTRSVASPVPVARGGAPTRHRRAWVPVLPVLLVALLLAGLVELTQGHALWLMLPVWWLVWSVRGHRSRHRDWHGRWQDMATSVEARPASPWHEGADRRR